MTVQTIPAIKDMTPTQRADLMEELWKAMSAKPEEIDVPEWHKRILDDRRQSYLRGETGYTDWEDAKIEIRKRVS
jgi:hypothetical protein